MINDQLAVVNAKSANLAALIVTALPEIPTFAEISAEERDRVQARLSRRESPAGVCPPSGRKFLGKLWGTRSQAHNSCSKIRQVNELKILEEHVSKLTNLEMRARYVFKASKTLKMHMQELDQVFKRLKNLVETAWKQQHPNERDYEAMTCDQRQLIALAKIHAKALQEAQIDRIITQALYDSCCTVNGALKLDLNLLDTQ